MKIVKSGPFRMRLSAEKEKKLPTVIVGLFSLREKVRLKTLPFCLLLFVAFINELEEVVTKVEKSAKLRMKRCFHASVEALKYVFHLMT